MKLHAKLVATFALVAFSAASISAATITVTSTADDGSAGTLRTAIASAASGDVVAFDNALAGETFTLDSARGPLEPAVSLSIIGPAAGVTLSGGNAIPLVCSTNPVVSLTFRNLTFANAQGNQNDDPVIGPAVSIVGAADIESCTFRDNVTNQGNLPEGEGGGTLRVVGNLRLVDCDFLNSGVATGARFSMGGVGHFSGADILVSGCSFVHSNQIRNNNDETIRAGGAFSVGGACTNLLVENTFFASNRIENCQGAVAFRDDLPANGLMRFRSCIFRDHGLGKSIWRHGGLIGYETGNAQRFVFESCEFYNSIFAGYGGVVRITPGTSSAVFLNCTFAHCRGNEWGSVADARCRTYFINCTVVGNVNAHATTKGGTLFAINHVRMLNTACVYNHVDNGAVAMDMYKYGGTLAAYNCYTRAPAGIFDPSDNVLDYVRQGTPGETATPFFVEAFAEANSFSANGNTVTFSQPVLVPVMSADPRNPATPRVVEPLPNNQGGVLDKMGWPVKANADYSYVAYTKDAGATWIKLHSAMADDPTATLITADSRGLAYPINRGTDLPMPPIGSATAKTKSGSLIVIH
ncbi:MAG: hypothetical protein ACOX9C_03490 [Kiritimatiellia bacterium]